MTNIKDISDAPLNRLHEDVTELLIEVRDHCVSQSVQYRALISKQDSLKYTLTLTYVTCTLTSGLAKLYMIMGYTKGEITAEELQENLKDIRNDMMKKDVTEMYTRHTGITNFVEQAEDLNSRLDHIANGGIYNVKEGK